MTFTDFSFPVVLTDLSLTLAEKNLYSAVGPLALPEDFLTRLRDDAELARAVATEKARAEFIVAPVLLELRRLAPGHFGLFSGVELKADPKVGGDVVTLDTQECHVERIAHVLAILKKIVAA